jgi:hypothetical protein
VIGATVPITPMASAWKNIVTPRPVAAPAARASATVCPEGVSSVARAITSDTRPPAPSTIAVTTIVELVRDFTPDAKSAKPQARAAPRARTISTAGSVGQGVLRP